MSTIIEKVPASGENCVVFEPKEALIYPFDVGNWNQLRVSVAISLTTFNNTNGLVTTSDISTVTDGSFSTCMFFGLTNATGVASLGQSGYNFLGIGTPPNNGWGVRSASASFSMVSTQSTSNLAAFSTIGSGWQHNPQSMNSTVSVGSSESLNPIQFTLPSSLMTGTDSYAGVYSLRFYRNDANQSFQNFTLESYSNYSMTDVSKANLSFVNSIAATRTHTGFRWNYERNIDGGIPLPNPNNFILYSPFTSDYRFRVHSLLIEKYA